MARKIELTELECFAIACTMLIVMSIGIFAVLENDRKQQTPPIKSGQYLEDDSQRTFEPYADEAWQIKEGV